MKNLVASLLLLCFFQQAFSQTCGTRSLSVSVNVDENSASLSWTHPTINSGCTGYQIQVTDMSTGASSSYMVNGASASTYNISGLTPGDYYSFNVVDYGVTCRVGTSTEFDDVSGSASAGTYPLPPGTPSSTVSSSSAIAISWPSSTGDVGYHVDVATDAAFTSFVSGYFHAAAPTTNFSVTGLSPNTTYYYRIYATSAYGVNSNYSAYNSQLTLTDAPVLSSSSSVAATAFTANWSPVAGATGYRLDVSSNDFSTFVSGYNDLAVSSTSQAITGLTAGTTYKIRVRAINAAGASASSAPVSQVTVSPAPVASAASDFTSNSFTANWAAANGAASYLLDVSSSSNFSDFVAGYNGLNVSGTHATVNGLSPGRVYYYRVRAVNAGGTSPSSTTVSQITVPTAPMVSAASSVTASSFIANWSSVVGATTYRLDVSSDNFSTLINGYSDLSVSATSQAINGLIPGTMYNVRVRAVNAAGVSGNSIVVSQITISPPPVLSNSASVTDRSFTANWAAAAGATSYLLDVSSNGDFTSILPAYNSLSVNGRSQEVAGLDPGIVYYIRVRAVNAAGVSVNSTSYGQITLPAAPVLATASNIGTASFVVNWLPVTGANGYRLDVSNPDSDPFVAILQNYTDIHFDANTLTATVSGLSAGKVYYYRVRAVNDAGTSLNSLTGSQLLLPAVPGGFTISDVTSGSVKASWQSTLSASGFELQIANNAGFEYSDLLPDYNPKFIPSILTEIVANQGLAPSTVYYLRVRAVNASGYSDYSAIRTVQTLSPSGVDLSDITIGEVQFPATVANESPDIVVKYSGGIGGVSVSLFHRANSAADYTREDMTASDGEARVTIQPGWIDDFGMEFYIVATDNGNHTKQDAKRTVLRSTHNFSILLTGFGRDASNYKIISFPMLPASTKRIADLFEPIMNGYDKTRWRLVQYKDGRNQDYADGLSVTEIKQGQGLWFISKEEVALAFGEASSYSNSLSNPFTLPLKKGWNQIGNPFPYSINWRDVLADNPHADIGGNLYVFSPENVSLVSGDVLSAYSGGFVFANNDTQLTFKVTLAKASGGRVRGNVTGDAVPTTSGWKLPITLKQGNITNVLSGLGMHQAAQEGMDKLDEVAVPHFFQFVELTSTVQGSDYPLAFNITSIQEKYTWHLNLESSDAGAVELSWDNELARNLHGRLLLFDHSGGVIVDMDKASSYRAQPGTRLSVYYDRNDHGIDSDFAQLGKPYPVPFKDRVTLPVGFYGDGVVHVYLSIYDLNGQEVFRSAKAFEDEELIKFITWDGYRDAKTEVPAGLYLYRIQSVTTKGVTSDSGRIVKD